MCVCAELPLQEACCTTISATGREGSPGSPGVPRTEVFLRAFLSSFLSLTCPGCVSWLPFSAFPTHCSVVCTSCDHSSSVRQTELVVVVQSWCHELVPQAQGGIVETQGWGRACAHHHVTLSHVPVAGSCLLFAGNGASTSGAVQRSRKSRNSGKEPTG